MTKKQLEDFANNAFCTTLDLRVLITDALEDEETKDHIFKLIEDVEDAIQAFLNEKTMEVQHG